MNIVQTSENTLVALFEQVIKQSTARQVALCQSRIEQSLSEYVVDIISSYASITLVFDFRKISGKSLESLLLELLFESDPEALDIVSNEKPVTAQGNTAQQSVIQENTGQEKQVLEIPVYYDKEVGFDLVDIATDKNLTINEVIKLHSGKIYDVYAVGFAPGFAYLGSVDEQITMPRKKTPRKHVPVGSLGIADQQTAIYPSGSPGGWQIIGRTPIAMVDYKATEPSKVKMGDKVRFVPISKQQFIELGGEL